MDWMEELRKLKELKDDNILSDAEFEKEKAKILEKRPEQSSKQKTPNKETIDQSKKETPPQNKPTKYPDWVESIIEPSEASNEAFPIIGLWGIHVFFGYISVLYAWGEMFRLRGAIRFADALNHINFFGLPIIAFPIGIFDVGVYCVSLWILSNIFSGKGSFRATFNAAKVSYLGTLFVVAPSHLLWVFAGPNLLDEPSGFFAFLDVVFSFISFLAIIPILILHILAVSRAHQIRPLFATIAVIGSGMPMILIIGLIGGLMVVS